MLTGVYMIVNKLNNRIYIGSSKDIEKRWSTHIYCLKNQIHHNKKLLQDFRNQKENDFELSVLMCCDKTKMVGNEKIFIACTGNKSYNRNYKCSSGFYWDKSKEAEYRYLIDLELERINNNF